MNPLFPPMIMDALPEKLQNHASSLMQVMWSVGWFMATAISGVIQQRYGYAATTLAAAATLSLEMALPTAWRISDSSNGFMM